MGSNCASFTDFFFIFLFFPAFSFFFPIPFLLFSGTDVLGSDATPEGDVSGQTWVLSQWDVSSSLSLEGNCSCTKDSSVVVCQTDEWSTSPAVALLSPLPPYVWCWSWSKKHKLYLRLFPFLPLWLECSCQATLWELGWSWLLRSDCLQTVLYGDMQCISIIFKLLFLYTVCFSLVWGQPCAKQESWAPFLVSKSFRTDAGSLSVCCTHSLGWRVLKPARESFFQLSHRKVWFLFSAWNLVLGACNPAGESNRGWGQNSAPGTSGRRKQVGKLHNLQLVTAWLHSVLDVFSQPWESDVADIGRCRPC